MAQEARILFMAEGGRITGMGGGGECQRGARHCSADAGNCFSVFPFGNAYRTPVGYVHWILTVLRTCHCAWILGTERVQSSKQFRSSSTQLTHYLEKQRASELKDVLPIPPHGSCPCSQLPWYCIDPRRWYVSGWLCSSHFQARQRSEPTVSENRPSASPHRSADLYGPPDFK